MKYKYRLILRGDNKYTFEYKPKGLFSFMYSWNQHYNDFDKEDDAVIDMNRKIKLHNDEHNKKYKKVLKVIENE